MKTPFDIKYRQRIEEGDISTETFKQICEDAFEAAKAEIEGIFAKFPLIPKISAEDVGNIFDKVRELQTKYSATSGCYQEVADWFNNK